MGKAKATRTVAKVGPYLYPSRFGSHRSMMVQEGCLIKQEQQTKDKDGKVTGTVPGEYSPADGVHCVLKDEFGEYETELNRLDNGLSDPNRYRESRLGKLFEGHQDKDEK